jgi:hypothetical protein
VLGENTGQSKQALFTSPFASAPGVLGVASTSLTPPMPAHMSRLSATRKGSGASETQGADNKGISEAADAVDGAEGIDATGKDSQEEQTRLAASLVETTEDTTTNDSLGGRSGHPSPEHVAARLLACSAEGEQGAVCEDSLGPVVTGMLAGSVLGFDGEADRELSERLGNIGTLEPAVSQNTRQLDPAVREGEGRKEGGWEGMRERGGLLPSLSGRHLFGGWEDFLIGRRDDHECYFGCMVLT